MALYVSIIGRKDPSISLRPNHDRAQAQTFCLNSCSVKTFAPPHNKTGPEKFPGPCVLFQRF